MKVQQHDEIQNDRIRIRHKYTQANVDDNNITFHMWKGSAKTYQSQRQKELRKIDRYHRQVGRQVDRQVSRQKSREIVGKIDWLVGREIEGMIDKQADRQVDRQRDRGEDTGRLPYYNLGFMLYKFGQAQAQARVSDVNVT